MEFKRWSSKKPRYDGPPLCGKCTHFRSTEGGECHAFPPQVYTYEGLVVSRWPDVKESDSCGQFEPTSAALHGR